MKKLLLTFSIGVLFLTLTSSCERCIECSYTYTPYGSTQDSTIHVAQECGNKQDRQTDENEVRAEASLVGGEVTCDN